MALLLLLASLAGCGPNSQRQQARGLTPGDSLSRRVAEALPVTPLTFVRELTAPPDAALAYPGGILFTPDGAQVWVIDTQQGRLHTLGTDGSYGGFVEPGFQYPYLAGRVGDTLAVWSRGAHRLDLLRDGAVRRQIALPDAPNSVALLRPDGVFFKSAGEEPGQTFLARFDFDGREQARYALRGPYWRHIGQLRMWGDTLLALSGYRPALDLLAPGTPPGTALDTLALVGFDSPQLNRSLRFLRGDVPEPPLLTPAAVAVGDRLFVLNIRTGWVRLDVYDRAGRLQHVLQTDDRTVDLKFFPVDFDARALPDGTVAFAVLLQSPAPKVWLLTWQPTG